MNNSIQSADKIENVVTQYSDMLFKISLVILGHEADAQDAVQETFIKYMTKAPTFNDDEHQKAWLIRVATNICKDMCRFRRRHTHIDIDQLSDYYETPESAGILEAVLLLPFKYKVVIHLYYVEGYDIKSIADIIGISVHAVKKRLQRGREMLRIEYKKEDLIDEGTRFKKDTLTDTCQE